MKSRLNEFEGWKIKGGFGNKIKMLLRVFLRYIRPFFAPDDKIFYGTTPSIFDYLTSIVAIFQKSDLKLDLKWT